MLSIAHWNAWRQATTHKDIERRERLATKQMTTLDLARAGQTGGRGRNSKGKAKERRRAAASREKCMTEDERFTTSFRDAYTDARAPVLDSNQMYHEGTPLSAVKRMFQTRYERLQH